MRKYFWGVLALAAVGLYFSVRLLLDDLPNAHLDLEVYRYGVQAWWHDQDMYGQLPPVANGAHLPFVYPPFSILILGPLAILPWTGAIAALYTINIICLAITLYLVSRRVWAKLDRRGGIMVAAVATPIALFFEPVNDTFEFGQVSIIMMAVIAIDCLAGRTVWPRGFGIGLCAAIKLTPAAFLLYFLVRKDYKAAITAGITWLAASAVGFGVDWTASIRYWFQGGSAAAGVSGTAFKTNQTINAVLARTGMPEGAVKILWLFLAAALLVLVALAMRNSEPVLALMANAGLGLLVSPTSWSHYFVWVVPTVLVMIGYLGKRWSAKSPAFAGWLVAGLATAAVFYLAPFHSLPDTEFPVVTQDWTPKDQVLTASYVLVGVPLLIAYAIPRLRAKRAARPAPVKPEAEPVDAASP
ncbi:glycosyltransferase family 87 protein [Amycolatopsis sp. CA-230715]|uniref:glycosyltransferase family 87 protein n=1 Tax=Amycolatopsis sp. CA-230715 TaxID=2745196 RepID=UPI001C0214B7|nr:glycosyltransferase family 87 protein [Amycolatopsis sp. CA-230715]QWF76831.1 Polyprenol-phosphate-mannose-dependent alpha-(1-2)-phosphatidylinositol mannoside mannosyltransferase [Amycolatopsis sp. CA-230715]